jgi:outer membrane protein TolC
MKMLSLVLVGLLAFPSFLWADVQAKDEVRTIEFSEIGPLVEIRNLTVEEATDGVEDAEDSKHDGLRAIDSMIDGLRALEVTLTTPDSAASPVGAYDSLQSQVIVALLQAQMQNLVQQRSSLTSVDVDKLEFQRDMAIDTITSGLETVYVTYNSLGRQLELLNAQKKLANAQLAALKTQVDLGMVTEVVLNKTENEIRTLEKSIQDLQRTRQTLKEQFNLALSYEFDDPFELGDVPVC